MGYLPIFLATTLFLFLWGIVAGHYLKAEYSKIVALSQQAGIASTLAATEAGSGATLTAGVRSLHVKMLWYNRLISKFPYKQVAFLVRAGKF